MIIINKNSAIKINGETYREVSNSINSVNGETTVNICLIAEDVNYKFLLQTKKTFNIELPYCNPIKMILTNAESSSEVDMPVYINLTFYANNY